MEELTQMRRDALQEIINISFGRASASLSELLNMFVALNVPNVQEIDQYKICDELEKRIGVEQDITIVQQLFKGDFSGEVLFSIPSESGIWAIKILSQEGGFSPDLPKTELEMEVFLEMGNIVIGACMGQFANLLNTSVSYEVPTILLNKDSVANLRSGEQGGDGKALLARTEFQLGDKALTGFLFILFSRRWLNVLYLSLDKFIENMT